MAFLLYLGKLYKSVICKGDVSGGYNYSVLFDGCAVVRIFPAFSAGEHGNYSFCALDFK